MKRPTLLLATALALLVAAPAAVAADPAAAPTRGEYVGQLEAICKPGSLATERAVRGVKDDIGAERLDRAAAKFARAEGIFAGTVAAIKPLPRPPSDLPRLSRWFGYLEQERLFLGKIAAALRAGETIASQHYTARFVHLGNLANHAVLPFGFHYCSFELTRFG